MVVIVKHVELKPGTEAEWDRAMSKRLRAAEEREGWVAGQLLRPVDKPHDRVIVGTWESREHWAAWHRDPTFQETRKRLDGWRPGRPRSGGTRSWRSAASPPDPSVA
jgi:heme-degrading monooxygenase HmoA